MHDRRDTARIIVKVSESESVGLKMDSDIFMSLIMCRWVKLAVYVPLSMLNVQISRRVFI